MIYRTDEYKKLKGTIEKLEKKSNVYLLLDNKFI